MSQDITELSVLLKTASDQLQTGQEVISQLAQRIQDLEHGIQARDLGIKLASTGQVPMADLPEKVAELQGKTEEDLELEEKVASMTGGPGHSLHHSMENQSSSALDFLS